METDGHQTAKMFLKRSGTSLLLSQSKKPRSERYQHEDSNIQTLKPYFDKYTV
jgi:hypothetical protein